MADTKASIDRKLERCAREIEEAKRKAQPLTPEEFHTGNKPGPDGTFKPFVPPAGQQPVKLKASNNLRVMGHMAWSRGRELPIGSVIETGSFDYEVMELTGSNAPHYYVYLIEATVMYAHDIYGNRLE